MKKTLCMLLVIGLSLSAFGTNAAGSVLFDFEDASYPGGPTVISAYMTDVYGSDVTVTDAIVGDGIIPGQLGPDHYIQAGPNCGSSEMTISFDVVKIVAVEFDWGVELNDFYAYADDDPNPFFHYANGCTNGHAGPFYFDSPVKTLKFTDSGLWEIEVDNLTVTPVPEPASLSLLAAGGLVTLRRRRNS